MTHKHLSRCLQLIGNMQQAIQAEKWPMLATLETEYGHAFSLLKAELTAADEVDISELQRLKRLEQQHRRMQRTLSQKLRDASEKLAVVEEAGKRVHASGQLVAKMEQK